MTPRTKLALIAGGSIVLLFMLSTFTQNWGKATAQRDLKLARNAAKACIARPDAAARQCAYAAGEISNALPELEKSEDAMLAREALKALADVQLAMRQTDAAITSYQKLVEQEPQQGNRHGALALALSKAGRHNEAIRAALLAVQLSPNAWQAHRLHGRVLETAGQVQAAIAAFEQAARLAPADQQAAARQAIAKLQEKLTAETLAPNETLQPQAAEAAPAR